MRFRNFEYFWYYDTKNPVSSTFSCRCRVNKCTARATIEGQNKIRFGPREHRHGKAKKVKQLCYEAVKNRNLGRDFQWFLIFFNLKCFVIITDLPVHRLADSEVPKPSIWYSTTELQFFTNQTGRKRMRFRNFEYTCYDANDHASFKMYCNCRVTKCPARATIDGQNNIRFGFREHRHRRTDKVPGMRLRIGAVLELVIMF